MDSSNINWTLAIASLLVGIGIGALGYHLLNSGARQLQTLRQRLAERDRELSALKENLGDHFSEVTQLVENLQRESEALARRLEEDAATLTGNTQRLGSPSPAPAAALEAAEDVSLPPPRDYADGTGGTLSEDFGLKSDESAALPQPPRY